MIFLLSEAAQARKKSAARANAFTLIIRSSKLCSYLSKLTKL
jgi:hypothetical protein